MQKDLEDISFVFLRHRLIAEIQILDAHNLVISSVKISGQDAKYDVEHWTLGDKVVIQTTPLSEGQEL